jgi:hypothetical protein
MESFNSVTSMAFQVSVQGLDSSGTFYNNLVCSNGRCGITALRAYTPVLYFLSPPVVYHGAMTALNVDPKWSTSF